MTRYILAGGAALCLAAATIGMAKLAGLASAESTAPQAQPAAPAAAQPKAVVDTVEHDFGFLQHEQEVTHAFEIANAGEGPLLLERGPTSCKCTMSTLPGEAIPPGGKAQIEVGSKIAEKKGPFAHTATILTNDPDRPRITLKILGSIREYLGAQPSSIRLSRETENRQVEVLVYSQVWPSLAIETVDFNAAGFRWEAWPADETALHKADAQSGCRVLITTPETVDDNGLSAEACIRTVAQTEAEQRRNVTVAIRCAGKADDTIRVFGKKFDLILESLQIGTLAPRVGARERMWMKARGQRQNIAIKCVQAKPDWLEVDVTPHDADRPELGLFYIDVVVPKDAPTCHYMGMRRGEVTIETDHPTIPIVKFFVEFAVVPAM